MAVELLYFWALSASLQAVLTPDLGQRFPSIYYFTYFVYHIGAVVAALLQLIADWARHRDHRATMVRSYWVGLRQ